MFSIFYDFWKLNEIKRIMHENRRETNVLKEIQQNTISQVRTQVSMVDKRRSEINFTKYIARNRTHMRKVNRSAQIKLIGIQKCTKPGFEPRSRQSQALHGKTVGKNEKYMSEGSNTGVAGS